MFEKASLEQLWVLIRFAGSALVSRQFLNMKNQSSKL